MAATVNPRPAGASRNGAGACRRGHPEPTGRPDVTSRAGSVGPRRFGWAAPVRLGRAGPCQLYCASRMLSVVILQ